MKLGKFCSRNIWEIKKVIVVKLQTLRRDLETLSMKRVNMCKTICLKSLQLLI